MHEEISCSALQSSESITLGKKKQKCNPYICDYMQLVLVFLKLFVNLGHTCNYIITSSFFILPYGQSFKILSLKNNPIWPIICNSDQNWLNHCGVGLNLMGINIKV
jgi:hypothetical protein